MTSFVQVTGKLQILTRPPSPTKEIWMALYPGGWLVVHCTQRFSDSFYHCNFCDSCQVFVWLTILKFQYPTIGGCHYGLVERWQYDIYDSFMVLRWSITHYTGVATLTQD